MNGKRSEEKGPPQGILVDGAREQQIRGIFEERVPFNRWLGLKVHHLGEGEAALRFPLRPELLGNFHLQALHGGVIASALDVAGALAVVTCLPPRTAVEGMGTVDMRVDYLRPARGERFLCRAEVLRLGGRLVTTRMEMRNEREELLACAVATYRLSTRKEGEEGEA